METINQELYHFLSNLLSLNEGTNFFLYQLPSTNQVKPRVWWLTVQSQSLTRKFITFEKDYYITYILNYRSQSTRDVDNNISQAAEIINNLQCFRLPSYQITTCHASTISANEDLDAEDMVRGSITITVRSIGNVLEYEAPDYSQPIESDQFIEE